MSYNTFISSTFHGANTTSYTPVSASIYTQITQSGVNTIGYINSTAGTTYTGPDQTNAVTYGALSTSATVGANAYGNIFMSELIIELVAMSSADRQILENDQHRFYGI